MFYSQYLRSCLIFFFPDLRLSTLDEDGYSSLPEYVSLFYACVCTHIRNKTLLCCAVIEKSLKTE